MTAFIDQAIRLSLVLAGALGVALVLRRRSAALRHWVIAAGILSSLALPIVRAFVPAWSVSALPASFGAGQVIVDATTSPGAGMQGPKMPASPPTPVPVRRAPPIVATLAVIWLAGMGSSLFVLAAGVARLAWHGRRGRPVTAGPWKLAADRLSREFALRRPVALLQAASVPLLGAWGWRHPRVLIPPGAAVWPERDVDLVLRHELAHIARGDWTIQLAAEFLRAVHWFNPLAWMACARLRLESERACDDIVLRSGVAGDDYADRLVHLAHLLGPTGSTWGVHTAPGMARPSSLRRRVSAMLDPSLCHTALSTRTRAVVTVLAFILAVPLAGLGVLAQGQDRFSGSVLDQMGKNVANAHIVLVHVDTKARYEIRSDAQGQFEFSALPSGDYDMEASLPGFMTVKGRIAVAPGGLSKDIKLQLGSVQETINITGKPPATRSQARQAPRERSGTSQQPACAQTAMGGNVRPPMKLVDVRPEYPEGLLAAKVGGLVVMEGILATDGTIRDLRTVETAPPEFVRTVLDAVAKWRFTPTLLNCEPADIKIKVNVQFVAE